jgi:hypothetical protein
LGQSADHYTTACKLCIDDCSIALDSKAIQTANTHASRELSYRYAGYSAAALLLFCCLPWPLCLQLVYASACLCELPGCLFVATNLDHADYIGNNRMMPGTGALVAALQVATAMEPVRWPVRAGNEAHHDVLCSADT